MKHKGHKKHKREVSIPPSPTPDRSRSRKGNPPTQRIEHKTKAFFVLCLKEIRKTKEIPLTKL